MSKIQNLIPESLQTIESSAFLKSFEKMDKKYQTIKNEQLPNHVLRYIGDLHGNLADDNGAELDVKTSISARKAHL